MVPTNVVGAVYLASDQLAIVLKCLQYKYTFFVLSGCSLVHVDRGQAVNVLHLLEGDVQL